MGTATRPAMPTAATTQGDTDAGRAVKARPASVACVILPCYL